MIFLVFQSARCERAGCFTFCSCFCVCLCSTSLPPGEMCWSVITDHIHLLFCVLIEALLSWYHITINLYKMVKFLYMETIFVVLST